MTRCNAGLLLAASLLTTVHATLQLPNTSGIDGQLTANHGVDHFFSLWLVFNNEAVSMSGKFLHHTSNFDSSQYIFAASSRAELSPLM
ncbi:hypothetical protein QE152_g10213 [Popillia japonica]|uniref:Uncharacterized protein n=1 Tax=Popillia japonica TaxID=7064 RepID=A0AAW1LW92_POPJA